MTQPKPKLHWLGGLLFCFEWAHDWRWWFDDKKNRRHTNFIRLALVQSLEPEDAKSHIVNLTLGPISISVGWRDS